MTTSTISVDHNDPVESSFIDELGFIFASNLDYDPNINTGVLFVLINGDAYKYGNVTWAQYEALRDADSVGHEYREFVRAHGASDEKIENTDLRLLPEEMRVPAPEDRAAPAVSEDQEEFDFSDDQPESFDDEDSFIQGDVLTISTNSNEQVLRETALSMSVVLLAGRKNASAALAIQYAQEFEEYLADA